MTRKAIRITLLILTLILAFSLTACGTASYSKAGIYFEIPKSFEPRAVVGADFAYGSDEAFIVFNKRTRSELQADGLSELDVAEFTDRFLTENEMKDAVEVQHFTDRVEFSYVVGDPDNEEVFYYYYTIVMKGTDCIWIIQMACYEAVAYEYAPEFDKWAASIKAE